MGSLGKLLIEHLTWNRMVPLQKGAGFDRSFHVRKDVNHVTILSEFIAI